MTKATRMVTATLTAACGAALSLLGAPSPALATVYEIASDGSVQQRVNGQLLPIEGASATLAAEPPEAGPDVPDAAVTQIADPPMPEGYRALVQSAASRYEVSPSLLAALARQESGWRQDAVSPKGAIGLTQLMPGTARDLAVNARDPAANLDGGARYLRQQLDRFDGDVERALAAYNAGPGRVARAGGVPAIPETRAYVTTIIDRLGPPVELARRNER